MSSVNKVILIGRLGADPEVRYTANGKAVANFNMATSESWNDKQGQKQERTEWHKIVAWEKQAELCGEYLSKGKQLYVEGKLQTRKWEDRDGNDRYTTEIQMREMTFLGGKNDGGQGSGQGGGKTASKSAKPESASGDSSGDFDYGPPPVSDDDLPF